MSADEKGNGYEKMERKRKLTGGSDSTFYLKRMVSDWSVPDKTAENYTQSSADMGGSGYIPATSSARQMKIEGESKKADESEFCLQKNLRGCLDNEDDTVFRNPPSPVKVKKSKPRPEPLFIPANVNHFGFGFQSRLRSPRLWDGMKKQTPPPYTPPPMLSPARSGAGLFWTLHGGYQSPMAVPPVLAKYEKAKSGNSWTEVNVAAVSEERHPPETDLEPHINVGSRYQPDLPHFHGCRPVGEDYAEYDDRSTLVWNPSITSKLKEEEVMQYLQYSCCAIIPGNGANKEYALHLLHLCNGDMKKAVKMLLEPEPRMPRSSGLKTYKYQDCVKWSQTEIELFHRAVMKLDKDFFQISQMVATKSVKDCVQFYYQWKKICPDELRQLKLLRRKREQFELYSRRSKDVQPPPPLPLPPSVHQRQKSTEKATNVTRNSKKHEEEEKMESSGLQKLPDDPFVLKEEKMDGMDLRKHWCSVCKRNFTSARNFAVHMKKHKRSRTRTEQIETDIRKLPYYTQR